MTMDMNLLEALLLGINHSMSADIADTLATWDGLFG